MLRSTDWCKKGTCCCLLFLTAFLYAFSGAWEFIFLCLRTKVPLDFMHRLSPFNTV
ncbi:unnamed protein product [Arabidopsis lyrata]|nr:unnamed protein product [Arabidopsis lyrata]